MTAVQLQTDSLLALTSGMGDPTRDKAAGTYYGPSFLTDEQLLYAYQGSWLPQKIVNIPAMDSIRKGRDWQAENKQIEAIEAEEKRLGLWQKLLDARIKARLWGGAAIYMGTDQSPETPLRLDGLGKGGLKYLTVLSRREVIAGELDQDALAETYGRPKDYQVTGATMLAKIHPSRLVVFVGQPHPDVWLSQGVNRGWGESSLQAVFDAVKNADSTAANIASLVFEANIDVFGVPNFMSMIADPEYRSRLLERFTLANVGKSMNRALIMDAGETYDRKQVAFSQLPEVLQQFLIIVSGAADIPATRLLGQSPAGMNATGESDMKNYHDRIESMQKLELQPAIYGLDEALIRSALGDRPAEIYYDWAPLSQMSEKDKADIALKKAQAFQIDINSGVMPDSALAKGRQNQIIEDGLYPGFENALSEAEAEGDAIDFSEKATAAEEAARAAQQAPANVTRMQAAANDAAPRTLYVRRDVVNAAEIIAWAKSQGMTDIVPDLHVTIIYSRQPLDWIKAGNDSEYGSDGKDQMVIPEGGPRVVEPLGGMSAVLMFASSRLAWRHADIIRAGAEHGFPDYQTHVSLTKAPIDLSTVEPYRGKIVLGPEIWEEVKED
ncbi:anti-CBASS protein Acb1 family protein [Aurantimonas coralicida]|uniref:phage portal protein n=1 Tax=Aurantimonas coralicida TaxID=182270 RepID=UPI0023A4F5E4|nr:anti-CBASS Acb1 family protein [Aurantimonas coralicida]MDE0924767.1 DUF1073 domain-containing protein [Aurantimonas coralicida]